MSSASESTSSGARADTINIKLFENLRNDKIENGNDVSWVVFNLAVQALIESVDVVHVNIEDNFFSFFHLLHFFDVKRSSGVLVIVVSVIIIVFHLNKVVDKVFEFDLDFSSVDVSSPQHLSRSGMLLSGSELSI